MAGKSLNKVLLIGNLTRDPELRYTPNGAAVCSLGIATNRSWTTDTGEKKEETEFHRVVAWRKLAEICGQYLTKGQKVYIEGHLTTRKWTTQDGQEKTTTEIVMDDMIMLEGKKFNARESTQQQPKAPPAQKKKTDSEEKESQTEEASQEEEHVSPDDIPF